jgi:excisionase family DNA binding protein
MKKQPKGIVTLSELVAAGEGYLDSVAVAKRLGVKPRTVGEWAKQGKLPAYRVGRYVRFKWAEVEAQLAETCRVGSGSQRSEVRGQRSEVRGKTESRNLENRNGKSTPLPGPLPDRGGEGEKDKKLRPRNITNK